MTMQHIFPTLMVLLSFLPCTIAIVLQREGLAVLLFGLVVWAIWSYPDTIWPTY